MGHSDRPPFDGKDPIGIIRFLCTFRDACHAVGISGAAAINIFQWTVSAEELTVIRQVLLMGSGNAPGGSNSTPRFLCALKYLLEDYLDEHILNNSLGALHTAKQHARKTENAFGKRLVDFNG